MAGANGRAVPGPAWPASPILGTGLRGHDPGPENLPHLIVGVQVFVLHRQYVSAGGRGLRSGLVGGRRGGGGGSGFAQDAVYFADAPVNFVFKLKKQKVNGQL